MPITPTSFPCMPSVCPPPGLYPEVSEPEYRRWAAWSQSILKGLGKWNNDVQKLVPAPDRSPAHVYSDLLEPAAPTEAQKFGTDYHRLVMEPQRFVREYVVVKHEISGRTNEGKAEWKALYDAYGEECVLDLDRWNTIHAMALTLPRYPQAQSALCTVGEHELSMAWIDPETGEPMKGRIDKLVKVGNRFRIVDLKTTRCAHWDKFKFDAADYGYHIQAACYVEGYAIAAGIDPALIDYYIVAQEKTKPYVPIVFKVPEAWLDAGRVEYHAALRKVAECSKSGRWPGYADDRVVDLHLLDREMAEFEPIES